MNLADGTGVIWEGTLRGVSFPLFPFKPQTGELLMLSLISLPSITLSHLKFMIGLGPEPLRTGRYSLSASLYSLSSNLPSQHQQGQEDSYCLSFVF